jgi:hypothetical protein
MRPGLSRLLALSGAAAFGAAASGRAGASAPPAPLSAACGRTAVLPNPASLRLAGDDASAARYTPNGRGFE